MSHPAAYRILEQIEKVRCILLVAGVANLADLAQAPVLALAHLTGFHRESISRRYVKNTLIKRFFRVENPPADDLGRHPFIRLYRKLRLEQYRLQFRSAHQAL